MLALASRGGSLAGDADAQVDIALRDSTTVDAAREQIVADATRSWSATRIAESSESDDEATVEFALPGASLDGFVAALRRQSDAKEVEVTLDVDPEQLEPRSLGTERDERSAPEPVRVEVNLTAGKSQGPLVTIIGALLVAVLAMVGLGLAWRRWGGDDPPGATASTHDSGSRRWVNRP